MGIFSRLKTVFKANANDAIDAIENPVSMSKEAIRQLKESRDKAIAAMANVEAIRLDNEKKSQAKQNEAEKWHNDAILLNQKIERNDGVASELEQLIIVALDKQEKAMSDAKVFDANAKNLAVQVKAMNDKISKLSTEITKAEEDLVVLESRSTTADAMLEVNKELSDSSENSAKAIMDRMNTRVTKQENLASAYENLSEMNKSDEDKINEVLNKPSEQDNNARLAAFRDSLKK